MAAVPPRWNPTPGSAPSQSSQSSVPHRLYSHQQAASLSSFSTPPYTSSPSTTSAPLPTSEVVNVKGILIAGWMVETSRGSIADSKTIDNLSDSLGIPLPEMPFDKNQLRIRHEGSGWEYVFDAVKALRSVEGVKEPERTLGLDVSTDPLLTGSSRRMGNARSGLGQKPKKSKRVKVAYAKEWAQGRENDQTSTGMQASSNPSSNFGPDVAVAVASAAADPSSNISLARDYDWTYSCTWPGFESSTGSKMKPGTSPVHDRIPVEKLGPPPNAGTPGAPKPEPILFYDDLVLYEDELGDNGASMLSVKVRVMPSGFLVLQRFFLRVDDVLFRIFDTRMYVGFEADDPSPSAIPSANAFQDLGTTRPPTTSAAMPGKVGGVEATSRQMGGLSLGPTRREMAGTSAATSARPSLPNEDVKGKSKELFRVIRECSGCQASYAEVRSRLPPYKPNDLYPLTDPGWVAQTLQKISSQRAQELFRQSKNAPGQDASAIMVRPEAEYRPPGAASLSQLGPATLPGGQGEEGNRILGQLPDSENDDRWEGEGARVDVAMIE